MNHIIEKALPYLAAIIGALFTWWQWSHSSAREDAEYYRQKLHEQERENDKLKADLLNRDRKIAKLENKLQEVQEKDET